MNGNAHALALIAVMAGVTLALRFLPFVLFARKTPKSVLYLAEVLPAATMAMLVVYCLRNVNIAAAPHGLPEAAALLVVVVLHKWKHNTPLSILAGTACYMVLLRLF